MPSQSAPTSRSMHPRNLANKRGNTSRTFVKDKSCKPVRPMKARAAKKEKKVVEYVFEDDVIVSQSRGPRDLRFTIPDVPANRDLLSFLGTRAHDIMGEVVRELHTVTKIKVCHSVSLHLFIIRGAQRIIRVMESTYHPSLLPNWKTSWF